MGYNICRDKKGIFTLDTRNVRVRDMLERVIQLLMYLANKPEGVSIRGIARALGMNPYVCSRYIDMLVNWGLVSREVIGRKHIIKITEKGIKAVVIASQLLTFIPIDLAPKSELKKKDDST